MCRRGARDITAEHPQKREALGAYESQLAYIDFAKASSWRDQANTVNIPDPAVQFCEVFADLTPEDLPRVRDRFMPLQRYLVERPRPGWAPAGEIRLEGSADD